MHDHAGRSAAVITPLFADERESLGRRTPGPSVDLRGLDRLPAGAEPGRQARSGAGSCSERAGVLVAELRAELVAAARADAAGADAPPAPWGKVPAGAALTPAGEVIGARTAAWLRARTSAPVLTPGYETELARRTGPDLFGLPPPPRSPAVPGRGPPGNPPPEPHRPAAAPHQHDPPGTRRGRPAPPRPGHRPRPRLRLPPHTRPAPLGTARRHPRAARRHRHPAHHPRHLARRASPGRRHHPHHLRLGRDRPPRL